MLPAQLPECLSPTRDEEFSVSSVLASDVIHASRRDVPCIFRVWRVLFLRDISLTMKKIPWCSRTILWAFRCAPGRPSRVPSPHLAPGPAPASPARLPRQAAGSPARAGGLWSGTSCSFLGASSPQRWPSFPSASCAVGPPAAPADAGPPLRPERLLGVNWSQTGKRPRTLLVCVPAG